jgi:formate/nitrite transporter FocA (FNT family)
MDWLELFVLGYLCGVATCLGVWFTLDRANGSPRWD